jgi:AcrR family transcriptional regulator
MVPPKMTLLSRDKPQKMAGVAECVARLLIQHGLAGVTHARVARAAHVSRAWLYKYVGSSREDLVRFTTEHFGNLLAEFDQRPRTDSRETWLADTVEGMRALLAHASQHPWLLPLYFRYQATETVLGTTIAEMERLYIATTAAEMKQALGLDQPSASWAAELLLAFRMAFAYRHQRTGLLRPREFERLSALLVRLVDQPAAGPLLPGAARRP